jgi:hypothetical protein
MGSPPECEERKVLCANYRAALRVYVAAIGLMEQGDLSMVEFQERLEHAEQCGIAFDRARTAFNRHVQEHGCTPLQQH